MPVFRFQGPVCVERYREIVESHSDHLRDVDTNGIFNDMPGPFGSKQNLFHDSSGAGTSAQKTNDLGLTDNQIVTGSLSPSPWFNAVINPASKTVSATINVNFSTKRPPTSNQMDIFSKQEMTDAQEAKLIDLAQKGVARFWSRTIDLDGDVYTVNVSLSNNINGMDIGLEINDSKNYKRSYNSKGTNSPLSLPGAVIYYQPNVFPTEEQADKDFQVTAAHEIGHSILTIVGGIEFSWGHKGTSGVLGGSGKASTTPVTGQMDLMKYYKNTDVLETYSRAKASESDVKNLIYISTRH